MRARFAKNQDLVSVGGVVLFTVMIYSLWGSLLLHAQHQANAQQPQSQVATRLR